MDDDDDGDAVGRHVTRSEKGSLRPEPHLILADRLKPQQSNNHLTHLTTCSCPATAHPHSLTPQRWLVLSVVSMHYSLTSDRDNREGSIGSPCRMREGSTGSPCRMREGSIGSPCRMREGSIGSPCRMREGSIGSPCRMREGSIGSPCRMREGSIGSPCRMREGSIGSPCRMREGSPQVYC
jgi:hypothetical protein